MHWMHRLAFLALFVTLTVPVRAANTTARLIFSHETARPGDTVWAGVHLRMATGWHTYWENGGDSGAATKVEWSLPAGITSGNILWPVPEKYDSAGLITYVYHNEVVLIVPLSIAPDAPAGPVELKAKVSWLECADLCLPGSASISAMLTIGPETKSSADAPLLDAWKKKVPQPKPSSFAKAHWEKASSGDAPGEIRPLIIEWTPAQAVKEADFYPFTSTNAIVQTATESVAADAGSVKIRKGVEKLDADWPARISGVLIEKGEGRALIAAHHIDLSVETGTSSPTQGENKLQGEQRPLAVWLGFAFLGGLILNLMPCVLPVIALKIFGFVNQARETPAQVRKLGIIYGLGVLFSFLVLAGLVVGVQSAGRLASWGMQFGNPYFLVGMVVLVTLVALNLFGLFEVTLSGAAMGTASALASREGTSGAFFNGVLATALATPCTAPFLAGALGFAFAQPPGIIVVVFLTVGLGLAAPYVVLSFQPAWLIFIPKPGAWMEKFKVAMGFPMLATALWLLSLTGRHYGTGGMLWVGIFLVFLAIAVWIWGEFVQRGQKRKGLAVTLSILFLAGGYLLALEKQLNWRSPPKIVAGALANDPDGIQWQPWSPAAVAKARSEGRPVFVDFTADWCVTCQANKKTSIEIDSVRKKLKEINAVALLGDYTLIPDDITEELKRFGKAGVPLVLVYPKDASKPPIELPSLLTPSIVLNALDEAAR